MNRKKAITIIVSILIFIGILIWGLGVALELQEAKETIENCKLRGWDGAMFKSKHNSEMVCANFTEAEKAARGIE